jgi:hypothetical protein
MHVLSRFLLILVLSRCATATEPVDVRITLATGDPSGLRLATASLSLSFIDALGTLAYKHTLELAEGAVPGFQLPAEHIGKRFRLIVEGFSSTGAQTGRGETEIDTSPGATRVVESRLYFGPIDRFLPMPASPTLARSGHSAIGDALGRMWLIGGVSSAPVLQTEIYDPRTVSTQLGPVLGDACADPMIAKARLGERDLFVVAGGKRGDVFCDAIQVIDATTLAVGPLKRMPYARAHGYALSLGGNRVAFLGGDATQDAQFTAFIVSVDAALAPSVDTTFGEGQPSLFLAPARSHGLAVTDRSSVYLVGGYDTTDIELIDPVNGRMQRASQLQIARTAPPLYAEQGGSVYVLGGGATEVERWTAGLPASGVVLGAFGTPPPGARAVVLPSLALLVLGGVINAAPTQAITRADLRTMPIAPSVGSMLVARSEHSVFLTSTNTLVVCGGTSAMSAPCEIASFEP